MSATTLRAAGLALLLPLAGCVNMSGLASESRYACAAPEGVACDSVSGTYANAVQHNLPSQRGRPPASDSAAPALPPAAAAPTRQPIAAHPAALEQASEDARSGLALRSRARVLRLWTRPWEDVDGDLWDQGYVYVQVDAGRWQIDHLRQRIRDQYLPLRAPPATASAESEGAASASGRGPAAPVTDERATIPTDGGAQRPSSFHPFPSLARPPAAPGSRPQ
ncbi:TraV family lipoprotein [Paracidovorax anthurii]|uniref:Conjugal transfer pilus assembly protein TraV n=1 Tax=Paracidovorax anthurii TaxID=78229 RepID=A0A328ZMJ5_9BURK|nr:TraV family lipoprotein [Paracidovorax anthurii]RAR83576.1 conjugal transfer pilus assembly protein TraV [Paracidovorax anthurii]